MVKINTPEEYREFARLNKNNRRLRREMKALFPGGYSEEDLADHLCFKPTGKHLKELENDSLGAEAHRPEGLSQPEISSHIPESPPQENRAVQGVTPPISRQVEERYAQYMQHYTPETPNDASTLWQLCQNEVTLEKLNERKNRLIETNARASDIKALIESITKISADNRSLQTMLGIDRPTRGTGQDAGDKLMEYVRKAKDVLHRQGVPIFCTNCYRSDTKIMNLYGFFVWHLQDEDVNWRLVFTCPRCGTEMAYSKETVADLKGLSGW